MKSYSCRYRRFSRKAIETGNAHATNGGGVPGVDIVDSAERRLRRSGVRQGFFHGVGCRYRRFSRKAIETRAKVSVSKLIEVVDIVDSAERRLRRVSEEAELRDVRDESISSIQPKGD